MTISRHARYLIAVAITMGLWNHSASSAGLALSIATQQSAVPVQIIATTNTLSAPYDTVRLRNVSGRDIATVTFAVLVSDQTKRDKPEYFEGSKIRTASIAPGKTKDLPSQVLSMADAQKLLERHPAGASIQIGVVAVEYADGTIWTYNAKATRHF